MNEFRVQKIDEALIAQHPYLESNDLCFFFGEYASHQGYQHSPMNQLIFNLKKPMSQKDKRDWHHKDVAISDIARLVVHSQSWPNLKLWTWVPMPPSKNRDQPDYDKRLIDVLNKMDKIGGPLDIRDMLVTKKSRDAAHDGGKRLTVSEHLENMMLNHASIHPQPRGIIVFDDVITSGAGFKAAQKIISESFPGIPIMGVFIARAISFL